MIPRVWTYWDGPMPPWIGLCLDTMRANIPGIEILTRETWNEIYDGYVVPREILSKQLPNVMSDFIRAWLMHTHGGVWIDADAIVFRDVRTLDVKLNNHDHVAYQAHGRRIEYCSALQVARKGGRIASRYLNQMVNKLLLRRGRLPKLALGPRRLTDAIRAGNDPLYLIPTPLVHPWPFWLLPKAKRRQLWKPEYTERLLPELMQPRALCFMLTHRALGPMKHWDRDRLLANGTVPAALFKRALK